jgi:hypothetical protein
MVYGWQSTLILENGIIGNNNLSGMGILAQSSEVSLKNTLIYGNQMSGINLDESNLQLINSTITDNSNPNEVYYQIYGGGSIIIINSIIWQSFESSHIISSSDSISIAYSNIKYGPDGILGSNTFWLDGNISEEPYFVNPELGNFNLTDSSYCIAQGASSYEIFGNQYDAPAYDLLGNARPNPPGSNPDIGSYENETDTPKLPVDQPKLIIPERGEERVSLDPVLTWNSARNAETYDIQLSIDSLLQTNFYSNENINDTTETVSGLSYSTKYFWRVRGESEYKLSKWSKYSYFITRRENKLINVPEEFSTIQMAIDSSFSGDTILVQPGIYQENINLNEKSLVLGSLTLTTGDTNYISQTIIGNTYLELLFDGPILTIENILDSTCVIDGFTFQYGIEWDDSYEIHGAGLRCVNSNINLRNLKIKNNNTLITGIYAMLVGGGIFIENSNVNLDNTQIINNSASWGGGIYIKNSILNATNLTIDSNGATIGAYGSGGGIYSDSSQIILKEAKIVNNYAVVDDYSPYGGGCAYPGTGAGIYATNHTVIKLINTLIAGNGSIEGGMGDAIHCTYNSTIEFINVTISNNKSKSIYSDDDPCASNPAGRSSLSGSDGSKFIFFNSVLDGKIMFAGGGEQNSLYLAHTNLKGGEDSLVTNDNCQVNWLAGNIFNDPAFIDEPSGLYQLSESSLCIGAGISSYEINGTLYTSPEVDLEKNPRPNPSESQPDIGAYEHPLGNPETPSYPIIASSVDTLKFEAAIDSTDSQSLRIYNNGEADLLLDSIYIPYQEEYIPFPFKIGSHPKFISPDDSADIMITFNPISETPIEPGGALYLSLKIECNDPDNSTLSVSLIGSILEPSSISNIISVIPRKFELNQNYPNPFNPSTRIKFALPHSEHVVLAVFNMLGQRVATLIDREMNVGYHEIEFAGSNLSSGVYFYSISAGKFKDIKKMILIR